MTWYRPRKKGSRCALMTTGIQSNWMRKVVLALFLATLLSTVWFGLRTYRSFLLLRSAYEVGMPEISGVRAWMTLRYVATTYRVSEVVLITRLGLPPETSSDASLKSLAKQQSVSPFQYVQRTQKVIAGAASTMPPIERSNSSDWLERLGEEVLSALLVYGYPILALTFLFGAVGFPLPTGLSAAVAGSLSSLGRMDWLLAGIVVITASVLGDVAAYGLGRATSRRFIERWGRWIGSTPKHQARARALFERWGGLTILLTRTLMSHLSSIVSLLAGLNKYRLPAYLAYDVLGRAIWTFAYMGLGYVLGANLEAATDFLRNLTGLLLSLSVFVGSGLAMWEQSTRGVAEKVSQ